MEACCAKHGGSPCARRTKTKGVRVKSMLTIHYVPTAIPESDFAIRQEDEAAEMNKARGRFGGGFRRQAPHDGTSRSKFI